MSREKPQKELGRRLAHLKGTWKLTQKEMAQKVGVALSTYQYYERGERDIPSSLLFLITTFGVSANWLLTGEGEAFTKKKPKESNSLHLIDIEREHINLIPRFKDKETAKIVNERLIDLERISEGNYKKVVNHINVVWEATIGAIEDYKTSKKGDKGGEVGNEKKDGTTGT